MSSITTLSHAPSGRRLGAVLGLVCLAQFVLLVDDTIVNVALPSIRSDLHFSETGLSWVSNVYFLTFGGFLLIGGRAADLLGRRRTFAASLALFVLGSAVCGLAPSSGVLVAARGLQGLAGALLSPAALSILLTTFTGEEERTRALGVWAGLTGLGAASGLLLGGSLIALASWRWVFFINVPVGLAALAAVPRVIPASVDVRRRVDVDVAGAALITAALLLLVFTVVETNTHPWGSLRTLAGLGGALVLLGGFVLRQRTAAEPLIPRALLNNRSAVRADLLVFIATGGLFAMFFFLTLYMQTVHGYSALRTGLSFLPFSGLITILSGLLAARLGQRAPRPFFVLGPLLAAAGLLLLTRIQPASPYGTVLLPGLLTVALGLGLVFVPLINAATTGIAGEDSGLASGLVTTCQQLGAAIGVAVLVTLASHRTTARLHAGSDLPHALTSGFHTAFVVQAVVMALGAVVGATLGARRPRPS